MEQKVVDAKIASVIEDIQEAIVESGGQFFRQKEVRNMDIDELLKLIIPNGIRIDIEYTQLKKSAPAPEFEGGN